MFQSVAVTWAHFRMGFFGVRNSLFGGCFFGRWAWPQVRSPVLGVSQLVVGQDGTCGALYDPAVIDGTVVAEMLDHALEHR